MFEYSRLVVNCANVKYLIGYRLTWTLQLYKLGFFFRNKRQSFGHQQASFTSFKFRASPEIILKYKWSLNKLLCVRGKIILFVPCQYLLNTDTDRGYSFCKDGGWMGIPCSWWLTKKLRRPIIVVDNDRKNDEIRTDNCSWSLGIRHMVKSNDYSDDICASYWFIVLTT